MCDLNDKYFLYVEEFLSDNINNTESVLKEYFEIYSKYNKLFLNKIRYRKEKCIVNTNKECEVD